MTPYMPMGRPFSQPAEDAPPTQNRIHSMFPSPFKWFNHLAASFERAAHPLLVMQAQPSETPLFDATVLATGVNPEPYEMDDEHQYEHSAYVTNDMAIDLDCLALPLYSVEVSR